MNRILTLSILLLVAIFLSCNSSSNNKPNDKITKTQKTDTFDSQVYLQKGKEIAMSTGKVLATQLVSAIETKGTHNALEFCNIKAIPLTDSMAIQLNTSIKRVSDKYRNPDNAANDKELQYITNTKQILLNNGIPKPIIFEQNNQVIGYYPIMTNALCLQCHGNIESDINDATITALQKNYPNDKATGYSLNELRGIWVIEMDR